MTRFKREKVIVCPVCEGTGLEKGDHDIYMDEDCHYCLGEGTVTEQRAEVDGEDLRVVSNPCTRCLLFKDSMFCTDCVANKNK